MANKWKVNTDKLRGRIKEKGLTIDDVAISIGKSRVSIVQKLNGKYPFTSNEIIAISNLIDDTPLIFFTLDVNKTENTNQII